MVEVVVRAHNLMTERDERRRVLALEAGTPFHETQESFDFRGEDFDVRVVIFQFHGDIPVFAALVFSLNHVVFLEIIRVVHSFLFTEPEDGLYDLSEPEHFFAGAGGVSGSTSTTDSQILRWMSVGRADVARRNAILKSSVANIFEIQSVASFPRGSFLSIDWSSSSMSKNNRRGASYIAALTHRKIEVRYCGPILTNVLQIACIYITIFIYP